jgi:hypothetical protein
LGLSADKRAENKGAASKKAANIRAESTEAESKEADSIEAVNKRSVNKKIKIRPTQSQTNLVFDARRLSPHRGLQRNQNDP